MSVAFRVKRGPDDSVDRHLQSKFGSVIRARRTRLGVSQEELAHLAGLHRTYVSLLERGQRCPSLNVMAALAKALETSLADLVRELEAEQRWR